VPELSTGYHATRTRITELARDLDDATLATTVPACPDWTVHDLVAHCVGIPEALSQGNGPAGDLQEWLDSLVEERRGVPVPELLERWEACAPAASTVVDGGGSQLLIDVVSHEHDLRGAIGRPGARGSAEVQGTVQLLLDLLAPAIVDAGLGALVIDSGGVRWASQFARPQCTLRVDPWEAVRVLQSRRTADEVRALSPTGDVEPYLAVLDGHSPLPVTTLGEA
jgi:uncharacterized protein (TIGR03083 family)